MLLTGASGVFSTCASDRQDSGKDEKSDPVRPASPTRETAIKATETTVITNDILESLYAGGSAGAPLPDESKGVDPRDRALANEEAGKATLKKYRNEMALKRTLKRRIPEARDDVAEAEAELKRLVKRSLAVRNPFLARPVLSAEEAEEWNRMDNVERLKRTEEDIRKARERLDTAREKLSRLEDA